MKYFIVWVMCCLSVFTASAQEKSVEKPEPLSIVKPAYPSNAFAKRLQGHVLVSYDIDKEGNVVNSRVVSSEPAGIFDEEALKAIRHWKFTPNRPWQGLTKNFTFSINMKSSIE